MIFIIDDDRFWTAILTRILNELGYKDIRTFSNSQQTLAHLSLNPELIFLDDQLGIENGLEFFQQIKGFDARKDDLRGSAYQETKGSGTTMEKGASNYLYKSTISKAEVNRILQSQKGRFTLCK